MANPIPSYAYAIQVLAGSTGVGIEGASFAVGQPVPEFDVLQNGWQIYGGGSGLYLLGPSNLNQVSVSAPGYEPILLTTGNLVWHPNLVQIFSLDSAGNYVYEDIVSDGPAGSQEIGYYSVSLTVQPVVVTPPAVTLVDVNLTSASLQTDPNQPNETAPTDGGPNTPDNLLQLVLVFSFIPRLGRGAPIPWADQLQIPFWAIYGDGNSTVAASPQGVWATPDAKTQTFSIVYDYSATWAEKNSPIGTDNDNGCIDVQANPIAVSVSAYVGNLYNFPAGYAASGAGASAQILPLDNNQLLAMTAGAACAATSASGW